MAKLTWAMRSNRKSGILLQLYKQMKKLVTSPVLENAIKKKYWEILKSLTKFYTDFRLIVLQRLMTYFIRQKQCCYH